MTNTLSALDFFSAQLAYVMSPEDLDMAQSEGVAPLVVDTRSAAAWSHSHIPGAIHIPVREIGVRAGLELTDEDAEVVVYSWGLGSVEAARAALALVRLGYSKVRELGGGFEAWESCGFPVEEESASSPLAG